MSMTIYSVLMSVICSDILIIMLYILRKKKLLTRHYGITFVAFLYISCIIRMLIPVEFNFTKPLEAPILYNGFASFINKRIFHQKISVIQLAVFLWIVVMIFLLLRYLYNYLQCAERVSRLEPLQDMKYQTALNDINLIYNKKLKIMFRISDTVSIPMGYGLINKNVILPNIEYNSTELHYVLVHECNHFYNRDLWVKFLTQIFCCIFWWNPVVYFLQAELEDTLEIKCDLTAVHPMGDVDRSEYMSAIVQGLKRSIQVKYNKKDMLCSTAFFKPDKKKIIKTRLEMISATSSKKTEGKAVKIVIASYIVVCLFSYTFVLQPSFSAPVDEIPNDGFVLKSDQVKIIKTSQGAYYMQFDGTDTSVEISEEEAKLHIKYGVQFIEEDE